MSETATAQSAWSRTPDARYHSDATFRQLVDMMEAHLHNADFTPTEMREASLLAAIHFEQRKIRHSYTMSDESVRKAWLTVEELYRAIQKDERPFDDIAGAFRKEFP